jgi:HK97 family phage major capsid protein
MAEEKVLTMANAVEQVKQANEAFKEEVVKKAKEEVTKVTTEMEAFKTKAIDMEAKFTAQGATLTQIQEEIKAEKAKAGRQLAQLLPGENSVMKAVRDMVTEHQKDFALMDTSGSLQFGDSIKMETKVGVVTSASLTGQAYGQYMDWRAGMEPTGQIRFRDLVRTVQSDLDTVYYPRANNPVGTGSFGKQTSEGSAKAQVDRGWAMQTLTLLPFAGYTFVSRQSLRNIPFLQSWLPVSLNEQLMDAEDIDFANTLVAASTGISTTTGITVAVERLIYFIKNNIQAKFYPTAIAIDPTVWAEILVTKPSNYSIPSAVTINPVTGRVLVLGVPIYPVNWLTGRRVLLGDFTKTAIVESEGLTFRQSNDVNDNFIKNVVCFLLERVEGLMINRTDAFITAVV